MNQPVLKSATPPCIDLTLTIKKSLFMRLETFENGLSNFHKVTTTILPETIPKGNLFFIGTISFLTKTNLMKS